MAFALPTGRRGQTLALALTLIAGASIWIGVVAPVSSWYEDRDARLLRQQAIASHMAALVASLPALRQAAAPADAGAPAAGQRSPNVLLLGASDPLAAATLQQRINDFAAAAGVHVATEEILPAQTAGGLRAISVRLTMNAPYRSLVALLLALARSETPMVVDELLLRGPAINGAAPPAELPVDASLTVTLYRAASDQPK